MIQILVNSVDVSDQIIWETVKIDQNLTSQVDTASFQYRKYGSKSYAPEVDQEVEIYDGSEKIFGGNILKIDESVESAADGVFYNISCADWTNELDDLLVSRVYDDKTITEIITDMIDTYAPGFTYNNVDSTFLIEKIVFNQVPVSTCLKRLADVVKYEWYVDADKDIHFFSKFTNSAPFDLTDTSGNYIVKSLKRIIDGTQIVNRVKVRGGEYDAAYFEDSITVSGDDTKSFKLPYKFSDFQVWLNTVEQTVGVDNFDVFGGSITVLYNYQERSFRFENSLSDGDIIKFAGYPKKPILVVSSDPTSIAQYGLKEKLIRDNTLEDVTTARKRAIAEVNTFKNEVSDVSFNTYTPGLRTGMVINVDSTLRDFDEDFIIKKVSFKAVDPNNFYYVVSLVTTRRYGLIELLQKLLEPDALQADETEAAEVIEVDIVDIHISELIQAVAPYSDIVDIAIAENIQKDPLGPGVEPTWVWANYFPSSISDPKRQGHWDKFTWQ